MKNPIKLVIIGIAIIIGIYSVISVGKYNALIGEIKDLQRSALIALDGKASSIKYRFSVIITDNKITDQEVIDTAFLIEEFRNIVEPYGAVIHLNNDDSSFMALSTVYGKAWKMINIKPSDITVDDVKEIMITIDVFRNDVLALQH